MASPCHPPSRSRHVKNVILPMKFKLRSFIWCPMMIVQCFTPSICSMPPWMRQFKKSNGLFYDTNLKAVTPIVINWCQQANLSQIWTFRGAGRWLHCPKALESWDGWPSFPYSVSYMPVLISVSALQHQFILLTPMQMHWCHGIIYWDWHVDRQIVLTPIKANQHQYIRLVSVITWHQYV